ncbi:MAG: hypothetical protein KME05_09710 [Gloeocapsa sp. UFS-A4-WI-NPMV-4B04]|jgi:hypothetical protein|nr:hypothetical protein [Gloeocapsa sp. UFS-A4-WI-NPMV-4B04]
MQKLFLTTTLSTALIPFLADFSFASPLSVGSQYPEVLAADWSVCYIQLADGKTLDLGVLYQPKDASNNYQASYYLLEQCKARSQHKRWASLYATQPSNLTPIKLTTSSTRC